MEKKRLDKLFYGDRETYEQEYRKRFDDPDTFHLSIIIAEQPAFFYVTPKMLNQVAAIERLDKEVVLLCEKKKGGLPGVALAQFVQDCLIGEILQTNNIEGVYSTRKDIDKVLQNPDKRHRFQGIVRKYQQLRKDTDILLKTSQDIRNLYDDLFSDEIAFMDKENLPDGHIFRKGTVGVHSATDQKIHSGLYPESKIIDTMDHALQFLHDDSVDILIRIAAFHYLFGYIHPFYDGNGRTSRFISSYLLSQHLHPLMGYRISYTIKEHIHQYYKAFKVCNDPKNKGDLTPFIETFLGIVETAERNLLEALEIRHKKLHFYHARIPLLPEGNVDRNMKQLYYVLIQAALFSNNGISRNHLEETVKVSAKTLSVLLSRIPETMLLKQKQGRRDHYMLDLDAVNDYLMNLKDDAAV